MEIKEKLALLEEEVLDMAAGELKPETALEDIDTWDSMAALSLIVLMEDKFSKKLTRDNLRTFVTVQDILNFMG
ncbi:acyl carrier protein [Synergistes jonesii]|uniref:Carrier domain-containing protein n=1 Tax=Synergistes jonesii TaxID=2754 RepID=A0A073IQW9_9BACT|nr:acyl carrier protein [Synergistes jonesii]KEJ92154.1 hypothetical protein EH55_05305 [Synergistes jonesii]OFB62594.1 hypothetical protein JS73_07440 [Synergistes jonesii]OFB63256.1 hypothetical protein JS79_07965 [Synergistes jonesii]OFB64830.1 hypothetical protein JS72_03445 [Synergistes jonesii]OFB67592.1 hypothetical protein JS78_07445 [Synergistes jonesii]